MPCPAATLLTPQSGAHPIVTRWRVTAIGPLTSEASSIHGWLSPADRAREIHYACARGGSERHVVVERFVERNGGER
jgi:hypothetical protein